METNNSSQVIYSKMKIGTLELSNSRCCAVSPNEIMVVIAGPPRPTEILGTGAEKMLIVNQLEDILKGTAFSFINGQVY